ncbi:uncharacterized protein LOC107770618 [Nicotiana tabacum]|uniref:Uncharacterized protein LOC107770618 n=1 Tax=Nicotiana tabacum TaxID=4097 RepID=A0AC58SF22_TOBAC
MVISFVATCDVCVRSKDDNMAYPEWWYNTNFHTSLRCTSFEALYGYPPLHLSIGPLLETIVPAAEDVVKRRQQMHQLLKDNPSKPYRQTSIALRKNVNLSSKYYVPYKVLARIGQVAYKLELPPDSKVQPVFHVSLFKRKVGNMVVMQTVLPSTSEDGYFLVKPVAILQRQMVKKNNAVVVKVLVQWSNLPPEDATWKDYHFIRPQFPDFDPHS